MTGENAESALLMVVTWVGERDPGYLGIAHVDRPPRPLPLRGQFGGFVGRPRIEIQYPISEILFEQARKCRCKGGSAFPIGKQD